MCCSSGWVGAGQDIEPVENRTTAAHSHHETPPMRVTVLHNPGAGDDELSEGDLRTLLGSAGYDATYRSVKAKGWKTALEDPGDLVVVAGGDGTVAKVARRLAGRGIPMALLPAGTANNIARSFDLHERPESLVARWKDARVTPVDLGLLDGPMGQRWFIEGIGLGVFPDLMAESARRIPKKTTRADEQIPRNIALMIELLEQAVPVECEITADGQDLSGAYLILEIMNIRSIGPRVVFNPEADHGDGLVDIVAITEADRNVTIDFLRCCREGNGGALDVSRIRAGNIRLAWESSPLHIDDDRWPASVDARRGETNVFSTSITVERGAIDVLL